MSFVTPLIQPLHGSAVRAILGLHVAGPVVPPPVETDPFAVAFGDAELTITPLTSPAPAGFTLGAGDGTLTIIP